MGANEARYREAERRLWKSVDATPTERRVHLQRRNVTVRVQELGAGPAVLFVHGASNGGASWASLAARLADFHCILLDRPGCALSTPLPRKLHDLEENEAYADTLIPDVLDALGLPTAHIAATSYGGYFALRAAAAHPDRIDRVIEFSWPFGAPMAKVPLTMRLANAPIIGPLMARVPPTERAVRMILRQVGLGQALESGRFTQESIDWFLALLRDTHTLRNELRATPRIILPIRGMNERVLLSAELLAKIDSPVHFLWGEADPNGGADIARRFVDLVPDATLELMPGVGHAPWIDDTDHAEAVVRAFLNDETRTPRHGP